MQDEVVLCSDDEGVRTLTLNRPERSNAWTFEMEERYFQHLVAAAADPTVRVVVVTGAGKAFCPGMDMEALASVSAGGSFSQSGRIRQTLPLLVPKPVIAAINGACAGIGIVQSLMADIRFASSAAKFSTAFARRGLPAENAVAWLLARLVGTGNASELLLSGRTFQAEEASELGLVNRVIPADHFQDAVRAYAHDLASNCSPGAMGDIKSQVWRGLEMHLEDARVDAKEVFGAARQRPDFAEGVASFLEKRAPAFEGVSVHIDADALRD